MDGLKKKMHIDFDIDNYTTAKELINDIIWDNNNYRPFALQDKNQVEFRNQLGFK